MLEAVLVEEPGEVRELLETAHLPEDVVPPAVVVGAVDLANAGEISHVTDESLAADVHLHRDGEVGTQTMQSNDEASFANQEACQEATLV
jgi:hypothetical protein